MTRSLPAAALAIMLGAATPASADYPEARATFDDLGPRDQATVVIGLIASGDFEAVTGRGFSVRLFDAIRSFEQREGFIDDGVLEPEQLQRLGALAGDFQERIGARYYEHPQSDARLLVPRRLFDDEKQTPDGLLFTRRDGLLSLVFLSFPARRKSYEALWETLSADTADKQVIYERRFDSRFVVTGTFHQSKFYTMMARDGQGTTGFTFSWGASFEELGRQVSTFLANAWLAEIR